MEDVSGSSSNRRRAHHGDGRATEPAGGTRPRLTGRQWAEAGALVGIGATVAAWRAAHRRDLRAVERDPANAILSQRPRGEEVDVVSRDGTRLRAELFGPADAPPLVLVHGWTCARRFWRWQVHGLADRFRIVTYDLRGHGESEAPRDADFTTDALADDLQAVLEATIPPAADGTPRPALLAGHSLGAMSIVAWAGRQPDEVARRAAAAALCNTGIDDLVSRSLLFKLPAGAERLKALVGGVFLGASAPLPPASPISMRAVRYVALSPSASPAQVAFCQEMVLACRRDVRASFGRTLTRLNLAEAIGNLTVPTLLVGGDADRLTPPPHVDRLAQALPQVAEELRLPGSGHMGPIEDGDAVNAALVRLAERAGLAPAAPAASAA